MVKAVKIGDIMFGETADGYSISHMFSKQKGGRRFRICEGKLTAKEVKGLGIDPETGNITAVHFNLRLVNGEDYWCLILEPVDETGTAKNLGKVPDEVVAQIFYHRTPEGTPFPDLSYDTIKTVRKAREERVFREKMIAHIEDTRAIRDLLAEILIEMRKPKQKAATPRKKPTPKATAKTDD